MDVSLTTSVRKEALALYPKPEIFNTDQGSQYTSKAHTDILKKHNIKISMDGVGKATDNICIERFWRSRQPNTKPIVGEVTKKQQELYKLLGVDAVS